MTKLINFFLGKYGLTAVWYGLYYAFVSAYLLSAVAFSVWVMEVFLRIYNSLISMVNLFNTAGGGVYLSDQIFGLLNCLGVLDGIVTGAPLLISSLLTVLLYLLGNYFYRFYRVLNAFMLGFKPNG